MSDYEPYVRYVRIPVNGGRGYYLLTQEYFATCTIKQLKSLLREIRYNKYMFSDQDINKLFYFIGQGVTEQLNYLNDYKGYTTKKNSLKKKLEILSEERGTYYDV